MRGSKPIWAIVDPGAYSAAYAIASCADTIIMPRTGGVGSIGVFCLHVDVSKALEEFGVKITAIQFGAQKTERQPFWPLSDEAKKRVQGEIDMLGELFVGMVARNRGMSAKAVRETQAGIFMGEAGVEQKLADDIASPGEALEALINEVN
jgi:ClpP class serine protease